MEHENEKRAILGSGCITLAIAVMIALVFLVASIIKTICLN